jgi:putative SOS response-associated peptidase YedK
MCGRFALSVDEDALMRFIRLLRPPQLCLRFNIAPTQPVLVIMDHPEGRVAGAQRWGLIPPFLRDKPPGRPLINARAESLFDKPSFRGPARRHRCLLPATGFYEWEKASRQAWLFRPRQGELMALAGIWQPGDPTRAIPDSVAIVTTSANATVAPVHHRMPVIVPPGAFDTWLDPEVREPEALAPLLAPAADDLLSATALDGTVNDRRAEGPACWTPKPPERQGSLFG